MARSSSSVKQIHSFRDPFYLEADAIGKEEPPSDNKSSDDAVVPSLSYEGSERFDLDEDLEEQLVPEVDQQMIVQPTVSSSSESVMDSDREDMMIEEFSRGDVHSPRNNTVDPIMEDIEYHPNNASTCMMCHRDCMGIVLLLCCGVCLCRPCAELRTQCPHCNKAYVMIM